jgi:hypothetical protein
VSGALQIRYFDRNCATTILSIPFCFLNSIVVCCKLLRFLLAILSLFYSFCASFLQSPCTAVCLSFDMTSLSSDKWERRPHKNSDVLYRWHWDSLFRFFIFFFVFVKLCHFLAVVFLSLRRCSPVCRASWRKKKTRSVIMFGDSCHSLFSCPLSYFSFRTACLVMETSFISGS